jgi:hypothetical protein
MSYVPTAARTCCNKDYTQDFGEPDVPGGAAFFQTSLKESIAQDESCVEANTATLTPDPFDQDALLYERVEEGLALGHPVCRHLEVFIRAHEDGNKGLHTSFDG